MPTYEYECSACGQLFEVRQRISDAALEHCIHCGASVHRVLAAAPFILKGSGFYVNDYPSESRKKGLTDEKKATADSGASSSTAASPTPSSPESSSSKP